MNVEELEKLDAAIGVLLRRDSFAESAARLNTQLRVSHERFVWSVVALGAIDTELPAAIKSCWIFLLRKDTPSGCHYHPNSIQHMTVISGRGRAKVGGVERTMIPFGSNGTIEERWYVIAQGVPHEFFPDREDMTVVSFHTCAATELEEVACGTGEARLYESSDVRSFIMNDRCE